LPVLRPAGKLKCMNSLADLQEAITEGAVKRIRPKFMTVATMFLGLAPIMWSAGAGSDVTIFTSFLLELVVYPALYEVWRWHSVKRQVV
jgi:Cu(I)/Ag(I) efflux system membrane protein CusA/SilA